MRDTVSILNTVVQTTGRGLGQAGVMRKNVPQKHETNKPGSAEQLPGLMDNRREVPTQADL